MALILGVGETLAPLPDPSLGLRIPDYEVTQMLLPKDVKAGGCSEEPRRLGPGGVGLGLDGGLSWTGHRTELRPSRPQAALRGPGMPFDPGVSGSLGLGCMPAWSSSAWRWRLV